MGECGVCLDERVLCVLLKTHPDTVHNTEDDALNYPLAFGDAERNQLLCPDVVCVECAAAIFQANR